MGLRGKSKYFYRRRSPHRITPINGERVEEEAETFEKYEIR